MKPVDYSDKAFRIAEKMASDEVYTNQHKYDNPFAKEMELTLIYYEQLLKEFAGPSEV